MDLFRCVNGHTRAGCFYKNKSCREAMLRGRAVCTFQLQLQHSEFQSMLPMWGATFIGSNIDRPKRNFNPRSPCGERQQKQTKNPLNSRSKRYFSTNPAPLLFNLRKFLRFFLQKLLPKSVRREGVSLCDCASHQLRNCPPRVFRIHIEPGYFSHREPAARFKRDGTHADLIWADGIRVSGRRPANRFALRQSARFCFRNDFQDCKISDCPSPDPSAGIAWLVSRDTARRPDGIQIRSFVRAGHN